MATQAEIEAQLASIREQMALPKASSFGSRSETARDMAELVSREAQLLAQLDGLTSTPRPRQRLLYQAGKGL